MSHPLWIGGLSSFIEDNDPTKNGAYDVHSFYVWGKFPTPQDAFDEGFDSAQAHPPIDNEGQIYAIPLINVDIRRLKEDREERGNKLTLHNPGPTAAGYRTLAYLIKANELIPEIQGKLEKALS